MSESAKDDAPLTWARTASADSAERNAATAAALANMIRQGERQRVLDTLDNWSAADVMRLVMALRTKRAKKLIGWLPEELGLGVLAELDPRLGRVLMEDAAEDKVVKLARRLNHDRALRLIADLPEAMRERVIPRLPEPERWREDLSYLAESAGAMMRRGFLAIREDGLIGDVIEDIQRRSDQIEKLDALYVTDEAGHLTGYLRIRDLMLCPPETRIGDVMRADVVSVDKDMDREAVLRLAEERRLRVVAVTDRGGHLIGCVTPAELAEISRAEAREDLLLLGGVSPESSDSDSPFQIVMRRLPWLMGGLVGASVAASVIASFEDALARAAVLASFIPVIMATAGNAGIQASTVTVQALTGGDASVRELGPRLLRELAGAALNGLAVGAVVSVLVLLASLLMPIDAPLRLALTAATALVIVTALASTAGAAVPVILDRLGLDPAVATGIFITTSNDVFGVLTFFLVASWLYL
ncbi:MAG: magnesium transporter [Pseudomonadota bacterium]